jgi:hypothetical protein
MRSFVRFAALGAVALASHAAAGVFYSFQNITNNSAPNAAAGEAQLLMEVDGAGNQAWFRFTNSGATQLIITDLYFDDGTLLALSQVTNGPGVSFSTGANPGNLPGATLISPPFQTTAGFSADSDPPIFANGVAPGEWVQVLFELQSGQVLSDVIASLADGRLRVGLHVQGYVDGGSESFIHMPAPGSAVLMVAGAGLVARRRRR